MLQFFYPVAMGHASALVVVALLWSLKPWFYLLLSVTG
jgi:hypothetical protein